MPYLREVTSEETAWKMVEFVLGKEITSPTVHTVSTFKRRKESK